MAENINPSTDQRYHSLDALKASMMGLGLVLHAAINYATAPPDTWGIRDQQQHILFDLLFYFIHLFRMPLFFLIAGFFAALLYYQRGLSSMISNRIQRVLLPLLIFGTVLLPVNAFCFVFAAQGGGKTGWRAASDYVLSGHFLHDIHLAHLWFLYYLLYLYAAAVVSIFLIFLLPRSLPDKVKHYFKQLLMSKEGVWLLSIFTFLTLIPMSEASLDTSTYLWPVPRILFAYGLFFSYGWLLYLHRALLPVYTLQWKRNLILAIAFSCLYLYFYLNPQSPAEDKHSLLTKAMAAIAVWYLIYAIIGSFLRFTSQPSSLRRYLSDASYWMYIIHLPLSALIVGLLAQTAFPAFVKFFIVLGLTFNICFLTYHYLVRPTFLGMLLNGRRYVGTASHKQPLSEKDPVKNI